MKSVIIIGVGMSRATITQEGLAALDTADAVSGAPRLTALFADTNKPVYGEYLPDGVKRILGQDRVERLAVLVSGDTGFFSAAEGLVNALFEYDVRLIPGISSLSCFFAKLKRPWQDAAIISCHGREGNIAEAVRRNRLSFVLTGGNAAALGKQLCEAGFAELSVTVGENLGLGDELIRNMRIDGLAGAAPGALSVLLIENPDFDPRVRVGIPDDEFIRGDVPMTKAEVRAVTLGALSLRPDSVCCDVGCGTGAVSVEMALSAYKGHVFCIDKNPEALALLRKNAKKFHIGNITPISGGAPDVFETLPALDAVFIGGSGGRMEDIVSAALKNNPRARIVINAVALESVSAALSAMKKNGLAAQIIQLSVSRSRLLGGLHAMAAQNPVFIISGGGNV